VLQVLDARKRFGGVVALDGAAIGVATGEIHALLGENGAGKSTLLKALAGVHALDSGSITLDGHAFRQGSTRLAREQGIAVIYQEPSLFPDLTLAENVFVGRQLRSGAKRGRTVAWTQMRTQAAELFAQLGVSLDPDRRAKGLSIADQQIVEIAKAMSLNARVIVMDEPTAALSSIEVERLFSMARRIRDRGASVVFVSHRLDEVFALCDRLTVMRDGATVATSAIADCQMSDVVRWMVGRELTELFPKTQTVVGETVLNVVELASDGQFHDVSFCVKSGEIVALAGLVGSGRSEVARAIFGVDAYTSGRVEMKGRALPKGNCQAAMGAGLAMVPEDRRLEGLFMSTSIKRNATMSMLGRLQHCGLVDRRRERELAGAWADQVQLKYASIEDPVERLSGGNQQKVVLAKWLATEPQLLIIDEPTRGIDVGTKAEIHRFLSQQAAIGLAVLMISSELSEVLGMADRILVMREGEIVSEFTRHEATQEGIMTAATQVRQAAGIP
jgi:rhamnose transport system ATP-binding protein